MSRYAVLSDIHGNLPALEATLRAISRCGVDDLICLGDIVGYGPHPDRCLDLVMRTCTWIVQGNHDEAVIDPSTARGFNPNAKFAIEWTRRSIGPLHKAAICQLKGRIELPGVLCCHNTPLPGATDYLHYPAQAALAFRGVTQPVCLVGHTHIPGVFEAPTNDPADEYTAADIARWDLTDGMCVTLTPGRRFICNPGAVGQPRDADPRASFAVLDLDARRFVIHRVEYDVQTTQLDAHEAGLPPVLAQRLAIGA